jgi:XTP/dITP diphosphohydrolase
MRLWLASSNPAKLAEIGAMLTPHGVEVLAAPADFAVVEDGTTFAANAAKKALALRAVCQDAALGDDSGLEVATLGGAPGIYSARYAGVSGPNQDAANRHKLLQALAGVPWPDRTARFVCVLALCVPGAAPVYFEGTVSGHISLTEAGNQGFGYDSLFVPDAAPDRTFAQLAAEAKHALSHRGHAVQALLAHLKALP